MAVVERLDHGIDRMEAWFRSRFARRDDATASAPTPVPWDPEMGPLPRVRALYFLEAWRFGIAGIAFLALNLSVSEESVRAVVGTFILGLVVIGFMADREPPTVSMDLTAPVPADVPIAPWWDRFVHTGWRTAGQLALVTVVVLVRVYDGDGWVWLAIPGICVMGALLSVRDSRVIARWENEHGAELIRPPSGSGGYYVRPRAEGR